MNWKKACVAEAYGARVAVVQVGVGKIVRGQTKQGFAGLVENLVSNSVRTIESH